MIGFKYGSELTKAIRSMLSSGGGADLAVAFWGRDAVRILGLGTDLEGVRIICDLRSGACNPDELKELLKRRARIWTTDGFHAKVYLTKDRVIIGSMNASANGLGEEGADIDANLEAGVETTDRNVIEEAHSWFRRQIADADPVDRKLIEELRADWKVRQGNPPRRRHEQTLLEALAQKPESFRNKPIRLLPASIGPSDTRSILAIQHKYYGYPQQNGRRGRRSPVRAV